MMIGNFASALELNKEESRYFKNLVLFNQAKTADEKQEYYSVMLSMADFVKEHKLTKDQNAYFHRWYNSVLRELVCLFDFNDNYELLGKLVKPSISAKEARGSVELLVRFGLIAKNEAGKYYQPHESITSGREPDPLMRRSFLKAMAQLGADSIERFPVESRNVTGITIGISASCYEALVAEMSAFRARVVTLVSKEQGMSRVYQMNLHLFPLSDDIKNYQKDTRNLSDE
jgi:uncharacterized protein (TIGR02147 family)